MHGDEIIALVQGGNAAALEEGGRAAGIVLDDPFNDRAQFPRCLKPTHPPAGHGPVFRKGVGKQEPLFHIADIQE